MSSVREYVEYDGTPPLDAAAEDYLGRIIVLRALSHGSINGDLTDEDVADLVRELALLPAIEQLEEF